MIKQKITGSILAACMMFCMPYITFAASGAADPQEPAYPLIPAPVTAKASSSAIRISWSSDEDDSVNTYYVMRRNTKSNEGTGKWTTIAVVASDQEKGGPQNSYTDNLSSTKTQQYEYKICALSADQSVDTRKSAYEEETNLYTALGTNIKICIDPGHYQTLNNNFDWEGADGKYPYSEGEFTLKIGKALKKELKEAYGIDSYMTRTSDDISLAYNGKKYTNEKLDQGNIAIRGYMAKKKDCDFFISLHTNSTSRQENIWSQPKSVNKEYVFVNQKAHGSDQGMKIANTIGKKLTSYNQKLGIQTAGFTKRRKNHAVPFTKLSNDKLNGTGTVLYRKSSSGADYYGVLRGANVYGIEGIIVEHAFHVTQVVRKNASNSTALYKNWAKCDAYGIAAGFGFADAT